MYVKSIAANGIEIMLFHVENRHCMCNRTDQNIFDRTVFKQKDHTLSEKAPALKGKDS